MSYPTAEGARVVKQASQLQLVVWPQEATDRVNIEMRGLCGQPGGSRLPARVLMI